MCSLRPTFCFLIITMGLCGKSTLLGHVQFGVHQESQVLFCKTVFLAAPSTPWCLEKSPGLGLCSSPCWTSWQGPSGWQDDTLMYQTLTSVSCSPPDCWRYTLPRPGRVILFYKTSYIEVLNLYFMPCFHKIPCVWSAASWQINVFHNIYRLSIDSIYFS